MSIPSIGNGSRPEYWCGSLALEIEGRLLLLPYNHRQKALGYVAKLAEDDMNRSPSERVPKVDFHELLQLLPQMPPMEGTTEKAVGGFEAKPSRDSRYYLDTVSFEVENCKFLLPVRHFQESTIFKSASLHAAHSNGDPINLRGVVKSDFEALLKLIHPPLRNFVLSQGEWKSVLRLATKWTMKSLRHKAVANLSATSLSPCERVVLGRECKVHDWVRSGYIDLAERKEALCADEFYQLGVDTALQLSQKIRRRCTVTTFLDTRHEETPYSQMIHQTFESELGGCVAKVDFIDRILLARKYAISEWLLTSFADLGRRPEDITVVEADKLGVDTAVSICRIRESVKIDEKIDGTSESDCLASSLVDEVFKEELEEILNAGREYGDLPIKRVFKFKTLSVAPPHTWNWGPPPKPKVRQTPFINSKIFP